MDKIVTKEALKKVSQALNDKIAQQDYIHIQIADVGTLSTEEKKTILKHIANWPDIILEDLTGKETRILARQGAAIVFYDDVNEEIAKADLLA